MKFLTSSGLLYDMATTVPRPRTAAPPETQHTVEPMDSIPLLVSTAIAPIPWTARLVALIAAHQKPPATVRAPNVSGSTPFAREVTYGLFWGVCGIAIFDTTPASKLRVFGSKNLSGSCSSFGSLST